MQIFYLVFVSQLCNLQGCDWLNSVMWQHKIAQTMSALLKIIPAIEKNTKNLVGPRCMGEPHSGYGDYT